MTVLRERMTQDMRIRNLSPHTQNSYLQQVSLFARYFNKSPAVLGPEEIRAYQVYLTTEKRLSPGSIFIAVAPFVSSTRSHLRDSGTTKRFCRCRRSSGSSPSS
jgi:hypothetical protein